jgi:Ala-tRNA(Pro) deacylase
MTDLPGEARLAELFASLGLSPQRVDHPPVHTVEEAREHWRDLPGAHTKNFFLKDNKGGALHLVTLGAETRIDMKALAPLLGAKKLSFAGADLLDEVLGTKPGAVSPLSLVNDKDHRVVFAVERALTEAPRLTCHPLRNTATVSLPWSDLARQLDAIGVVPRIFDVPAGFA